MAPHRSSAGSSAATLLVFGRGVVRAGDAWELTPSSLDRVAAAVRYVAVHAPGQTVRPRVIFTGGWPEASRGGAPPPAGAREGDLMLRAAAGTGLGDLADLYAETRSRSTLENLLHTVDDGLLAGLTFGPAYPLGLVSHTWHLPRVRFLVGKVLGLRGPALTDIPAAGEEDRDDRRLLLAARLSFLGARRGSTLLRRERRMVALSRLARQVRRARAHRRT
ncbi:ElyC/SanA/YdcF family protein [Actinoplanes sp. NPDC049265]|uniref:ElyC/SanA/YdcF family protein n=1 Tax=Actinoplanes sp. NPDC049265 TaxID=3363902 RepID=UPI003723266D